MLKKRCRGRGPKPLWTASNGHVRVEVAGFGGVGLLRTDVVTLRESIVLKQSLQRRFVCTLGFHRRLDLQHKEGEGVWQCELGWGISLGRRRERALAAGPGRGWDVLLHKTWVAFAGHARWQNIGHGRVVAGAGLNQAQDDPSGAACFTRWRRRGEWRGGKRTCAVRMKLCFQTRFPCPRTAHGLPCLEKPSQKPPPSAALRHGEGMQHPQRPSPFFDNLDNDVMSPCPVIWLWTFIYFELFSIPDSYPELRPIP